MKIISIISRSNSPDFNLATEEYLLKNLSCGIRFFYINASSVIIGKHQNAFSEVNHSFIDKNKIQLFRRLSGGGTVYHDNGNINFCFINNREEADLSDYKKSLQTVSDTLNDWNIPSKIGKRNELLLNSKKISGSACHVHKNRIMTHGTLLYDSNLDVLIDSLSSNPILFNDKAVKSVKSDVANIKNISGRLWSAMEFMTQLEMQIRTNANAEFYEFNDAELDAIENIRKTKYGTLAWNIGNSPSYSFAKKTDIDNINFNVNMIVKKGRIESLNLKTNHTNKNLPAILHDNLTGCYHESNAILSKLNDIDPNDLYPVCDTNGMIALFF